MVAVIPAYGRPDLLRQALDSLATERPALAGAIVVNNGRDAATARAARAAAVPVTVVEPACNLGTAGGIAAGMQAVLELPAATHAWILDDDSVAEPGALAAMLAAMAETGAEAAAPLIADARGEVRWVPCRLPGAERRFLREGPDQARWIARLGAAPRPWPWTIWASVVISRRAIAATGFPRLELWSQFSDIEYTLRVTARFRAVLAPRALCRHLPPETGGAGFDAKLYAALQNGNYTGLRLPHARRALRHLPGQHFRYLRHYGFRPAAWWRAAGAFWEGAVLGRPSGRTSQREQWERARAVWPEAGEPR